MSYPLDPLKTCIHLRSKEMTYADGGGRSQEEQDELEREYGYADTTAYWCGHTETGRGPDDKVVSRDECTCDKRSCFVGIETIGKVS